MPSARPFSSRGISHRSYIVHYHNYKQSHIQKVLALKKQTNGTEKLSVRSRPHFVQLSRVALEGLHPGPPPFFFLPLLVK